MNDDHELEPKLRGLLDSARTAASDFPEDRRAAMRAALEARLSGDVPSPAPEQAATAPRGMSSLLRAGSLVVLGAVVGAAGMRAVTPSVTTPVVTVTTAASAPPAEPARVEPPPSANVQDLPTAPERVAAMPKAAVAASASSSPAQVPAAPDAGSAEAVDEIAARPSTLKEERTLLDQARSALARRDGVSALEALTEHGRKFGGGKLAEEREALLVEALVARGRFADARRNARAFEAKYPHSVFLNRVEQIVSDLPDASP